MKKCPLCQCEKIFLVWKNKKYKLLKCKNCEILFLYPFPENPEEIYTREYFERWYLRNYRRRKIVFERLWKKIEEFFPEKGKLLDIGCGIGIFLDLMKSKGWDVYGQDISAFAVEYCKKKGYKVFKGNLGDVKISEKFDLITMFDVIAHVKYPLNYFVMCKKLLNKDTFLIV